MSAPDLLRAQRWLLEAIAGDGAAPAGDWIRPSVAQSAAARLEVYRRAYRARLLDCMRAIFPSLRHALGDDLFADFVAGYLQRHPPRSFTLDRLGDDFPRFLSETRPPGEGWPDFLVELATLESTLFTVADEPAGAALGDALLALHGDRLRRAIPARSPTLRLLRTYYPVRAWLLAARAGGEPALPDPAPEILGVARAGDRVTLHPVAPDEHALLLACDGARTVADLAGAHAHPLPTVRDWLRGWAARGWLAAM